MKPARKRCALYTRKSSDDGLDQAFNSLDAQREACAAYVRSQSGEGWSALSARYDDGGQSGGTMERPALQHLLADIAAGRIDIVLVYKIDRLTRSLADFARMVEIFERHEVSFVSVTQAFNTTSSMGRLTLNVLLSFAQFEREVTGERIRDKIAASKKKGMWMGGTLPLGYDLPAPGSRALAVNAAEADLVRRIFTLYVELGSVHALERRLRDDGIDSKRRVARSGRITGGRPFSRGALFHLLRNRLYLGEIPHRDTSYPGLHAAIIDRDLFDAVQARLDGNARRRGATRRRVALSPLAGRIFDADGDPMSPTFACGRSGRLYRYYVSAPLQHGVRRRTNDAAPRRLPAAKLEEALAAALNRLLPGATDDPLSLITRIEIQAAGVDLLLAARHLARLQPHLGPGETAERDPIDRRSLRLRLPLNLGARRGAPRIIRGASDATSPDPILIRALRTAHAMLGREASGAVTLEAAPDTPYRRRLIRLAFLAPDLQRAILEGRQSHHLTLAAVMAGAFPASWSEQRRRFGHGPAAGDTARPIPVARPTACDPPVPSTN
ncbi:recombinase family protein [Defluviimonas sp. SAOS-178_SWC]|uniref:recombinase family protein n=1 Tax=Defluviimonas sp. SAOS-178_SWC TaxID=3121287 RepID=UPI003221F58B